MVVVHLTRLETGDHGTFGRLILPNGGALYTLECPENAGREEVENEKGLDCIPPGEYEVKWEHSPKYGRKTYRLQNVPGRSGILIHSGNLAGNTEKGFCSDVEGCILLGLSKGDFNGQKGLLRSRDAVESFEEELERQAFTLIIKRGY